MNKLLFATLIIILGGCAICANANITENPSLLPVDANITKGPFLERICQERAAIMWESDSNEPEQLCLSSNTSFERVIVSNPEKIEYEDNSLLGSPVTKTVFLYKTWLNNLKSGQVYNYCIADSNIENETYKFHTIPANASEVTFAVYGDSRTNAESHRKLVKLIIDKHPDFVINTGDIVTSGNKYEEYGPQFFEPLKGLAEFVPVYVAKGNHDGKNGIFEKLLVPPGEKSDFGITYGPLYYYFADNTPTDLRAEELLNPIAANIRSTKAGWKFVTFHIPALNFGGHDSAWGYPNTLPMLAKAGTDFVVSGHSHIYERFKPVAPPIHSGASFVTYVTSGGGGANLYDVKPTEYHAFTKSVFHFCLFKIKGGTLTMDTFDIEGRSIDHLEISKTDGELNEAYRQTSVPMADVLAQQRPHKN